MLEWHRKSDCIGIHTDMPELRVVLPAELNSFFDESGYSAPAHYERRRHVRLKVRGKVAIEFIGFGTKPTRRSPRIGQALSKDLSPSSVCVLYHEQVFPEERFRIIIAGRRLTAIAVRCRKLGPLCFEVGAEILTNEELGDNLP